MQLSTCPNRLLRQGGRTKLVLWLALIFVHGSAAAHGVADLPQVLQEKIEAAEELCSATNNGAFALEWGAVDRVDLDGDGTSDWILNEAGFACSSGVSLYCGTGGCMSHFIISDSLQSLLNQGWTVIATAHGPLVLARLNSSACRGGVASTCFAASIWDAESGSWRSATAQWEDRAP